MKNTGVIIFGLLPFFHSVYAQIGGSTVFKFMNIPSSARTAALGGSLITVRDDDIHLVTENPAVISPGIHNKLGLTYLNYFTDINYGNINYSRTFKKYGSFYSGLRYMHYGDFKSTDIAGNITGEFQAADYSFDIGWSRPFDTLFFGGVVLKTMYSKYFTYTSFAQAIDAGGMYASNNKLFSGAVVLKNLGVQYKSFTVKNREKIPFEIKAAISQRLRYAPFRFNLTLNHLEKWDLTYELPIDPWDTLFADDDEDTAKKKIRIGETADKMLRHLSVGTEIILLPNFHLRIGYNYRLRQEMKLESKKGLVGFSLGFCFRVYNFDLSYGAAILFPGKASHFLTVTTNLSGFQRVTSGLQNPDEYR